ncbi:MAG: penicillin-binding protein 2, partial [Alphaproteobacteria bacterium]|nr:penicillin-binding protein 2 [Alphaproteobacteria bacterium]
MQREHVRVRGFSRRAALLGGGQVLLFSALVGRLYYLQITESDRYTMLAEDNRINMRMLPPPRGRIIDRHGVPMALNQLNYRAILISELTPDIEATFSSLESVLPISDRDRQRILREIRRKRSFVPVTIRENLDWDDVSRIEVNAPSLPGVFIEVSQSRYYPFAEVAGHVLGYVAAVSEEEQGDDPLLELPGFRIGKNGVEKIYDLALRGKAGTSHIEVDAMGRVIRELERDEGQSGQELVLTIDSGLQDYIIHRLEGLSAAAVVMDALNGEVLALVSTPGFDPNAFNKGLSEEAWRDLASNSKGPLVNKSISGQYAPGSTFKMMIALAALEDGIISPDQRFFCEGHMELGDSRFHCWKEEGHGAMGIVSALQQSCDVYFFEVALRTGIDRISEMARRFGLGAKLGIDLPSERDGLMPTRDWKLAVIGSSWQLGE